MSDAFWATLLNIGIQDLLKIPAVPTRRDRESLTVRKFAIFRYARQPRSPDESGRGMRSLSRFDRARAIIAVRSVL
jgi:hypothetical protein